RLRASRRGAGDLAEHRARAQARATRIVEVEDAADQLARRIEPADRLIVGVEHFTVGVHAQAAERKCNATGDRIAFIRWLIDRVRPVALVDREAFGAAAVLDVRVERNVLPHRLVPLGDGLDELTGVDAFELAGQLLDRIGGDLGDLPDAVLVALQVLHFLVEDLPGELTRLLQDDAAILRIGVVAEVGALIDEALAGRVDHDGKRVGMLLELVADREVAEFRGVHLPADRVAARPVAARARTDVKRHADAVAGVEAGAAHLGEIPAGAEIARAPFRIGLEAAGGEHDRLAVNFVYLTVVADAHAVDAIAVGQEIECAGAIADLDPALLGGFGEHVDEAGAAAD